MKNHSQFSFLGKDEDGKWQKFNDAEVTNVLPKNIKDQPFIVLCNKRGEFIK